MLETPRQSSFLSRVRAATLADFESELRLVERIAVYQAAGYRKGEIARLLDVSLSEFNRAESRLKRAAERLDTGD